MYPSITALFSVIPEEVGANIPFEKIQLLILKIIYQHLLRKDSRNHFLYTKWSW